MTTVGFGDLATSYRSSLQNARIKSDISRLSQELATGQKTDLKTPSGNELVKYASLEASIKTLQAYSFSATQASLIAETAQASLEVVQDLTSSIGPNLIVAGNTGTEPMLTVNAADAKSKFQSVVSALNARIGDRSLFAGDGVSGPALSTADEILANLSSAVAGSASVTDLVNAVDVWFDTAGGGFENTAYLGSTSDLSPFLLGRGETASLDIRADNEGIRETIKGYAMAALVDEGLFAGSQNERAQVLRLAGERLIDANDALGDTRARLGLNEAQIDQSRARTASEIAALERTRADLVAVDPYRVATELQAAETQLEMLYTVTARLSRLSLVDFLR
ncbi:MAG: flagellin [Pseudomonadota bacterium]